MDITIRDVNVNDSEEVVSILNNIIDEGIYSVFDKKFTVKDETDYIQNFPERGIFLVAENENKEIVGFHSLEPFSEYLNAFNHVALIATFIKKEYRGKGFGSKLLSKSFSIGKEKNYEKYFAYVREDNPDSLHFHIKNGFDIIGTSKKQAKIYNKYVNEVLIEIFL